MVGIGSLNRTNSFEKLVNRELGFLPVNISLEKPKNRIDGALLVNRLVRDARFLLYVIS